MKHQPDHSTETADEHAHHRAAYVYSSLVVFGPRGKGFCWEPATVIDSVPPVEAAS